MQNISRGYFRTDVGYWVFNSIREQNLHDVGKEMFDRPHPVKLNLQTSIGHVSWPMSTVIFFDQYRWIISFCQDGLIFSWPNKSEHASFGRIKTSVALARKNLADEHCKFFYATPKKENFICRKKNSICQQAFLNKNCAMSAEKYQLAVGWAPTKKPSWPIL